MWPYKWFAVKEREWPFNYRCGHLSELLSKERKRPFNYRCGHISDLLSKKENDLLITDVAI